MQMHNHKTSDILQYKNVSEFKRLSNDLTVINLLLN